MGVGKWIFYVVGTIVGIIVIVLLLYAIVLFINYIDTEYFNGVDTDASTMTLFLKAFQLFLVQIF